MPPIGALPPKVADHPAPAKKSPVVASQPPKQSVFSMILGILEGKQQLSIPVEVQVIFSIPRYLPFLTFVALVVLTYLVEHFLAHRVSPVDGLRAAIVGGMSGFTFRLFHSSYSSSLKLLTHPRFFLLFPLFLLLAAVFLGRVPFLLAFAYSSCAVITPKPKDKPKDK